MGDTTMRTKEQIQACLDLMQGEVDSIPKEKNSGTIVSSYVDRYNHCLGIVRILKWVLKRGKND